MRKIDAKTGVRREKSRGPRLPHGPADHSAARPVGPALDLADTLGIAHADADITRPAQCLRRNLADRAAGTAIRTARGGFHHAGRTRRLWPDAARPRTVGNRAAAAQICRAMAEIKLDQAAATVRLAPSTRTIFTRLPAGASGPATRQTVSSIRTVPAPSMIGFSRVNTRPTSAAARLLRNGLALAEALPRASRSHTGTAQAANTANIRSCACQDGCSANDTSPTKSAARPSQNRKTPGAISSSAIRTKPKISQFQVPSVENISVMTRSSGSGSCSDLSLRLHRRWAWGCRGHRRAVGGSGGGGRTFDEGRLGNLAFAGERAKQPHLFHRNHQDLLVPRGFELPERLDVFVGDEVVQRGDVALGDGLGNHLRRLGLGFGGTFARFGVAERG